MSKESFKICNPADPKSDFTISTANIDAVLKSIKRQMKSVNNSVSGRRGLYIVIERTLSNRYRGKGRPRKSDYDFPIDALRKYVGKFNLSDKVFSTGRV